MAAHLKDWGPLSRMRAHLGQLDGAYLQLATWFLALQPGQLPLAELTTGHVAGSTGLSRATVVRFCQQLGFQGFLDFKEALAREWLAEAIPSADGHLSQLPEAAGRVAQLTLHSLDEFLRTVDGAALARAAQAMAGAALILWFGCGDSAYLAASGEHKLAQAGKSTRLVRDGPSLRLAAQAVRPGDVVILISQSGRWRSVAEAAQLLRERGCLIITITGQAESPMAKAADILFVTPTRDVTVGGGPLTLRAPQTLLVDMLVLEAAIRAGSAPVAWEAPRVTATEPA